jgi:hypothetical protein
MSTIGIVVNGLLKPDGTLELDALPRLPPGRVRVTLQPLVEGRIGGERLPDAPWLDDAIPAPFDLPRLGAAEKTPLSDRQWDQHLRRNGWNLAE